MNLEAEALAVLERLRRYALPDDEREERLARMPASAAFAAGLAPLLAADERLPTAAILEVMREVEKVLIRYGGTLPLSIQLSP